MLVRLLCLCLGLAITTSAPVEGPQCVSSAVLDDKGRCVCPQGQIGDGYLCCVDASLSQCVIKGDPILESIHGVKTYIDFPCTHYVSYFSSTYRGRSCDITVLTSGTFVSKGFIFNNRISVEVSVDSGETESIQIFQNKLETTGETVKDFLRGQGPRVVNTAGLNFSISYDSRENMWTIEGCDAQFKYRPNQGLSPLQRLTPGICVTSHPNVSRHAATEGNLCNIGADFDEGPYEYVEERLLAESIELYREISQRVDLDSPELRPVCRDVSQSFEYCSPVGKVSAMRHCASILTNSLVRLCLFYKGDVFTTFRDCLAAYCGRDRSACNRLKNNEGVQVCTSSLLDCDQWVGREPEPNDQRVTEPSTLPQEEEVEEATAPPQPPREKEKELPVPREGEINEPIYTPEPREEEPYTPEPREEEPYTPDPREEEPYTPEPREEEPYTPESREEEPYTPELREEEPYTPEPREEEPYTPEEEEINPREPSEPEASSPKSPRGKGSGSAKSGSASDKRNKSRSKSKKSNNSGSNGSNKSKKSVSNKSNNSGSIRSNKSYNLGSNKSNKSGLNRSNKSNKSAGSKSKGTKKSPKSLFSLKSVKIGSRSNVSPETRRGSKSDSNLLGRLTDILTVPSLGGRNNSESGSKKSESGSGKSKKSKSKKSKSKKSGSKSKKSKSKKSGSKSKKSKGSKSKGSR